MSIRITQLDEKRKHLAGSSATSALLEVDFRLIWGLLDALWFLPVRWMLHIRGLSTTAFNIWVYANISWGFTPWSAKGGKATGDQMCSTKMQLTQKIFLQSSRPQCLSCVWLCACKAFTQLHMVLNALLSCDVSACWASIITTACSASWEHINTHEWRSTCTCRRGCVCVSVSLNALAESLPLACASALYYKGKKRRTGNWRSTYVCSSNTHLTRHGWFNQKLSNAQRTVRDQRTCETGWATA